MSFGHREYQLDIQVEMLRREAVGPMSLELQERSELSNHKESSPYRENLKLSGEMGSPTKYM